MGFLPYGRWDTADYFFMGIMTVVGLFLLFMTYLLLAWICKMIFYKTYYAEMKEHKGEVIEMKYVPPRTRTSYNAATKTTSTHTDPEKNIVIFKTDVKETEVNSDRLYQRVRIGESVMVKSQAKYISSLASGRANGNMMETCLCRLLLRRIRLSSSTTKNL